jgi:ABC-type multidrug transport system fused ATPase/permease subunit
MFGQRRVSIGGTGGIFKNLGLFLGARPWFTAWLVLMSVVAGISMSAILATLAEIAAALVARRSTVTFGLGPLHVTSRVTVLTVVGLGAVVIQVLVQVVLAYLPARMMGDLQAQLRDRLFSAFASAPPPSQNSDGEGQFQELVTNQVTQVLEGTQQATGVVTNGLMLAIMLLAALAVGPVATVIVAVGGLAVFAALRPLRRIGRRHGGAFSEAQVEYAAGVHQAVHLAEEAQVFGVIDVQEDAVSKLTESLRKPFIATQFVGRLASSSYQSAILLLLFGGVSLLQIAGIGQLASLGVIVLLLVRCSTYANQLYGSYHWLHQTLPFMERLQKAEQRYRQAPLIRGNHSLNAVPQLAFEDVSFSYTPDIPVLRGISFRIDAGEAIGIAGPTGAGKSTLVQLLLGLRQPSSGSYLVDGEPAASLSSNGWVRGFAYLPQEPRLLHGTVADNIRFFRSLDDDAIEQAARLAHIHDDIITWRDGYATVIGERADAVSGGQRQRIGLARALAADPFVLLLDEPTSALDNRSEHLIQHSLATLKGRMTLVVVAHRLTTLDICDCIIVVADGKIESVGAAKDLVGVDGFFRTASALTSTATPKTSS